MVKPLVLGLLVGGLTACGAASSSGGTTRGPSSPSAAESRPAKAALPLQPSNWSPSNRKPSPATKASRTRSRKPLHSPTDRELKPAKTAKTEITGYGATNGAWNADHKRSPGYQKGAAYDPDPTLPKAGGRVQSRYVTVQHEEGRVLGYEMNVHRQGLSGVLATARAELPNDARIEWKGRKDTCVQAQFASARLGHALGDPAIGDPSGEVFVEFSDLSSNGEAVASPRNFNDAIFSLALYRGPADAPGC
jgi:hypothetical protein